ncbi:MAG: TonB-dependent receptor, partial [Balneolaceae bacterium]|nr:TonB-dependent receptor [Balneolaceae bacterium]
MNLNKIIVLTFLVVSAAFGEALSQTIKVIDETTLQPVESVYIFNEKQNKTAVTNQKGEADISRFNESDYLIFQHPSFKRKAVAYTELREADFLVKLTERSVIMEEIYVSASKREQDQTEIPQKITQINEEQVRFSNPQTSADLLQASGKVFVQKSQMGGGSPMIRGFAANSVMIAVDGVRMNNAIFRSGNLQNVISLDPNAVQNTEVIFGPGSIIYGSDALGGVMNFQTKDPELSFSADETFIRSDMMARYASANNEKTIHADANVGYEKWGSFTSITYTDFDDLRSGGNFYDDYPNFGKRTEYVVRENGIDQVVGNSDVTLQRPSAYEQLNLMQKLRFKPSQAWDINYGFHYATSTDIPRYDRLIERENGDTGQFVNAEWYYGPQIWMMNALEVDHFSETSFYDKVSGVFSYQWFQESRNDRKFREAELRNREENVDVLTANIDFDKNWGENKQLFYGVEGIYNYVTSDAFSENIETGTTFPEATRYPDGGSDYTQLAAYAKYRLDLSSNITAVTGLRYSHVFLNSRFNSTRFYDFPFEEISINTGAVSGSLGFTWRPVSSLQFNLNGSTGFRAPNVDDAAKVFDSEPGTVVVPNENLESEYSYNID